MKQTGIYEKLEIPENDRPTSIQKEEGEWLYNFLKEKDLKNTLEIGFAYGCSAAYIMSATESSHVAIDPYQEHYKNLGAKNIEKLNLSQHLRLLTELSHIALPKLLIEGAKMDLAFIDGGHRFDDIFIDWFYCDHLLNQQGYIFFDDAWMESTQRVAAFVRTNRKDYEELTVPMKNWFAFQKIGKDMRNWDHFEKW